LNLLKKAPAAVPGCGNRPEDGPQSRLFSGESAMKVKLFATLSQLVGVKEIEVGLEDDDTVGSVLDKLVADHPVLEEHILDDDGNLEAYINVFVNGRSVRFLDGLDTSLSESDVLAIFPPVAGG